MGNCLSQEPEVDFDGPVDFDHFHILRAIGKGAFGKVCIVKKKDTKQMYAMKYMNKIQIIQKHAVENVFREIRILCSLENPFLVNLWFTFQDREDMFMVLDLMLGGDISYHLEKHGKFQVERVRLYIAEVALGLEYLRSKRIIHRDIKPANMLLDSQGHVHITDFNVATIVRSNVPVTSTTGTKPYMAPEVVQPPSRGYRFAVDWWSLGVSAYEMLRGHRPFTVEKNMSTSAMYSMLTQTRPSASVNWDNNTCDILKMLLHPEDKKRIQSVNNLKAHPFFSGLSWDQVEDKTITPSFIPPQNRINCDPTHELEEMIVEPNPLHKKRHRLSKRNVKAEEDAVEKELDKISNQFKYYNRIKEREAETQESTKKSIEDSSSTPKSEASEQVKSEPSQDVSAGNDEGDSAAVASKDDEKLIPAASKEEERPTEVVNDSKEEERPTERADDSKEERPTESAGGGVGAVVGGETNDVVIEASQEENEGESNEKEGKEDRQLDNGVTSDHNT